MLKLVAKRMKVQYNKQHWLFLFNVGDLVMVSGADIKSSKEGPKLNIRRYGPFKILKAIGDMSYKLKLLHHWKIHDTFHVSKLWPYTNLSFPLQSKIPPQPAILSNILPRKPEKILNSHILQSSTYYLFHYLDKPSEKNSWVSASKLKSTPRQLLKFYLSPSKRKP